MQICICKTCNKSFIRKRDTKGFFCSKKCCGVSKIGKVFFKRSKELNLRVSKSLMGHKVSQETKNKIGNANYKGENIGYSTLHKWVTEQLGRPKICSMCGKTDGKRYEWANISGLYQRILSDWIRLCKSCHIKLDKENPKRPSKRGYIAGGWTTVTKKGVGKPPIM